MSKRILRIVPAAVLLLCCVAAAAFAQEASTEEDPLSKVYDLNACVMRGLEANPSIVAARHELGGAEYSAYAALSNMLPTATASYGYTYQDRGADTVTRAGVYEDDLWASTLSVNQPLFPGISLLSAFQKAQLNEEYSQTKLTQAELNLIETIQASYFGLLKARMDVKSAEDSVERLKSQLQVTTAFFEVGLQPRLDVLQAEVDLATAEQQLLTAKNNVSIANAQLNSLLDLPLEAEVQYVGTLVEKDFGLDMKSCLAKAYGNRPDIIMGQKSVEMAGKDLNIAASDLLPSFDADWNYVRRGNTADLEANDDDWDRATAEYWTFGVTASYALKVGMGDVSETMAARETYRSIMAQLETTRLNAGFEVKQAHLNIQVAYDRIQVARKQVEASQEAYRMAVARYQAQVGTNTDVLDAQANVSSSEAQLNSALSDYLTALSNLYVAMGEKNPGLEVR